MSAKDVGREGGVYELVTYHPKRDLSKEPHAFACPSNSSILLIMDKSQLPTGYRFKDGYLYTTGFL